MLAERISREMMFLVLKLILSLSDTGFRESEGLRGGILMFYFWDLFLGRFYLMLLLQVVILGCIQERGNGH